MVRAGRHARYLGLLVNTQLQHNFSADPKQVSWGLVLAGNLAYANSGGSDAFSGGASATLLRGRY